MARIRGTRREDLPDDIREIWDNQERTRGAALQSTPIYALRPSIFTGHRALAAGIDESGLLPAELKNLASLRAALINGCPF